MNVIVTGGAGFLGSHVVELLISKKHFPIIIDNLSTGNYKNIKKFTKNNTAKFLKLDIRDFKNIQKIPNVSAVIHLAAVASISESFKNPNYVNDVNVNGTLNMLEFCRLKKIKKFVFISSASIFGDNKQKVSEKTSPSPTNLYGVTKLTGEHFCRVYSNLFNINYVILRPFNIFGPGQNIEYAVVIPKFISRINSKKPPIIFGDGKQTRDFIHVVDAARAVVLALNYKKQKFAVFHLASGKSTKILDLAKIMIKSSKYPTLKSISKKGPVGVLHSSTSIKLITRELGFVPRQKLDIELAKLLS